LNNNYNNYSNNYNLMPNFLSPFGYPYFANGFQKKVQS
jgi:hypothetical protein